MNVAKILISQIIKKLEKRYQKEINSLLFEINFINKDMTVIIGETKETKTITDSDLDSADIFISLIVKKMKEIKIDTDGIQPDIVIIDLTLKPEFADDIKMFYTIKDKKKFAEFKNILA
jgi:hypothetical protein